MFTSFLNSINSSEELLYIFIRTVLLILLSVIIVRYGNRRFNLNTIFDFLIVIVLGGVVSRGINGTATLLSTLVALITLICVHKILARCSFLSETFEGLCKGKAHVLIQDGKIKKDNLKRFNITENDLKEQMRQQLNIESYNLIKSSYLERTGKISFVLNKNKNS